MLSRLSQIMKKRNKGVKKIKNMGAILIEWTINNWPSLLVASLFVPLLFFGIKYFCNNYLFVIKISPVTKQIICNSESWRKESYYVYLTNRSSNPIYDINVVAAYPKEVEVTIMPEEQEMRSLGKPKIGTTFVISGTDQDKGEGTQETIINNLGANETKKLIVEINKKNYLKDFKLRLKAIFHSRTPKPILSN